MAIYSLAQRTGETAGLFAIWELQTGATDDVFVLEITVNCVTTGLRQIALGRPTSLGVGMTAVTFLAEDFGSPASTTNSAVTGWTTYPGMPGNFLRRLSTNSGANNGSFTWKFPEGLRVPVNSNLALWNLVAGFASEVNCVIDE